MNNKCVAPVEMTDKFRISYRRASEVFVQLQEMGFIEKTTKKCYVRTPQGKEFVTLYAKGKFREIHVLLLKYEPYRLIYNLLTSGKYTYDELSKEVGLNAFTIDVIIRLMKCLNLPVKKGEKGDYYVEITNKNNIDYNSFLRVLLNVYKTLSFRTKSKYVKIVNVKNKVKYCLRISDNVFKELFEDTLRKYPGLITLCAAPLAAYKDEELFSVRNRKYVFMKIKVSDTWF